MFPRDLVIRCLGQPSGPASPESFAGVSTDSRSLKKGELFIAIRGEQFDGHDFLKAAAQAGAGGLVAESPVPSDLGSFPYFQVESTLTAFRQLAGEWRQQHELPLLAIGGSVGKTSTKEFLASLLEGKFSQIIKTHGSQNGFLGIPLTLCRLRPEHEIGVVEIGIDAPGAMEKHVGLVKPLIAALTRLGEEHLENLGTIENVVKEETILLEKVVENGGKVVVNLDDPLLQFRPSTKDVAVTVSLNSKESGSADISGQYSDGRLTINGRASEAILFKDEVFPVPLPGRHQAENLLIAIAMAGLAGATPSEMKSGLAGFTPKQTWGRTELRQIERVNVLCDFYNSNPTSVRAALQTLEVSNQKEPGKVWICLGDMLDLGDQEEALHRELASDLADWSSARLLLVGERMKWLHSEIQKSLGKAAPAPESQWFSSIEKLSDALLSEISKEKQEVIHILLKGSRGMKMEGIWKILEKNGKRLKS